MIYVHRSLYERALDVEHRNITLWLKYAEMEMKSRQVGGCRSVLSTFHLFMYVLKINIVNSIIKVCKIMQYVSM